MPDNDFETDGKDPVEAIFITQPKQEMVNTGGEFRLPCFLETMSDYVLVWKFSGSGQTDTILSVDQKVIDREGKEGGRVSVEKEGEGNWLVVSQVSQRRRTLAATPALSPHLTQNLLNTV